MNRVGPGLTLRAMGRFLPMHLWMQDSGKVMSVGPTLLKLLPDLPAGLDGQLVNSRAGRGPSPLNAIRDAVDLGRRLFLRAVEVPDIVLRGHGERVSDGSMLVNLGFGIGLHRAIRRAGLTDDDFCPSDLAMEFLFLQEANRGVLTVLSEFNEELARARKIALQQAKTDALTGLHNRRGLEINLAQALQPAGHRLEETSVPVALIHLDLDNFKLVNDLLGHLAGDALLRRVGTILQEQVRKTDTAARIGGDEFFLIMKGMTSHAALRDLSLRIIGSIESLTPDGLAERRVSASAGIVLRLPGGTETLEDVLALTDKALYQAKAAGKGCAVIL